MGEHVQVEKKTSFMNYPRFKILKDGWVMDRTLRIQWCRSSQHERDFEETLKYASAMGAMIPTLKQLLSLVDYSRKCPAIDNSIFKRIKSEWYWTRSRLAGYQNSIWCVNFNFGVVTFTQSDLKNYVLLCRSIK